MVTAQKKANSNVTEILVKFNNEIFLASSLSAIGNGHRKVKSILRKDFPCPKPELEELWTLALAKASRFEVIFNKMIVGKSYREFCLRETTD